MPNADESVTKLRGVVDSLIGPDGCPWDKEQTPESLAGYFIEESHELVDAIRQGRTGEILEEMGDLFFLLFFLARIYEKGEKFTMSDILEASAEKMIRRHPHVFAGIVFKDRDEQLKAWEQGKREEKAEENGGEPKGVYDSMPRGLPSLIKAYRIHSRAARVGFTWPEDQEVEQQVEAEWLEWLDVSAGEDCAAQRHEMGDILFTLVELARRKGIKADEALDMASNRFLDRFTRMEEMAKARGLDFVSLSLDDKDELWNEAKNNG